MSTERRIISIHQPAYLPWLGYVHKIMISDVFVFLDTVQFEKNSFTNRNKILTSNGPLWLTVPVRIKGHTEAVLKDLRISPDFRWKEKHLKSIMANYSRCDYFGDIFPEIESFISNAGDDFSDFIFDMTKYYMEIIGIDTELVRASLLPVAGVKSELVKNICEYFEADIYISGLLGRNYIDIDSFYSCGIKVVFQDYAHPTYEQQYEEFTPGMSVLDLLMNVGPKRAMDVIMDGNIKKNELKEGIDASQS